MVGAVMAAFFAAGVIAQYLGGRLGDRIGHKRVLLLGLVGYAVASAGFLLPLNGLGYVALRAGQGAAAGAAQVAMLALVTQAVPLRVRGRAISAVYGGELGGVAVGPLVGSLIGVPHMAALFLVASAAALLAGLPVLASRTHRHDEGDDEDGDEDGVLGSAAGGSAAGERAAGERAAGGSAAGERAAGERAAGERAVGEWVVGERARLPWSGPAGRVLIGVMLSAIAGGVLTGIYESCWTLLLDFRQAQAWQIGASWTLFALPFVLGAPVAGWVADHYDRRVLVVIAMVVSVGFALLYPWVTDVKWLIGLGAAESLGVAFAVPAAQSMLGQATPGEQIGQAQGLFASIQTAAIAVTAGVSGALFSLGPWWPFTVGAVVALAITAALPWVWRGIPGRAGERIEASQLISA
jgi:DHA1 family multidrug resistance protein-like MFS transporter